ncbi:MAG: hypothetical protein ACC645_13985 [Pirellulales bacterium]
MNSHQTRACVLLILLGFGAFVPSARGVAGSPAMATWSIHLPQAARDDAAIQAAVEDLKGICGRHRIALTTTTAASPQGNAIVVGDATRNPVTEALVSQGKLDLRGVDVSDGFEIRALSAGDGTTLVVAGGSLIGDAYGLYWLWDRVQVHETMPRLNVRRQPALKVRHASGENAEQIRNALRYTFNWVSGQDILTLVPWDSEPEKVASLLGRRRAQDLIDVAHGYHMKYLAWCDEITYHPSMWHAFGATRDPADPALWQMLQEKYRRLFTTLPDLDGVRIRTGELTRVFGDFVAYDVMHEPKDHPWPLTDRYRTFVQKMHEVVVGEFDKIYFHRTWVTNTTEQHSQPDVFKAIFTDAVPTNNLYLSPYMTQGDRWFYQPINPTFNLTPHNMVVLLASMDYHSSAGRHVFPTFPGAYFHALFHRYLSAEPSNLVGMQTSAPRPGEWDSGDLTGYTAYRLAWEPDLATRTIAEDFAAIHFGRDSAQAMGEILLLSAEAYKHGLYIKPVAESIQGNTLPHLRLTTFVVRGFPSIDQGKAHIDWLRKSMFAPCAGRLDEAVAYLDRGLAAARRMQTIFRAARPSVRDPRTATDLGNSLDLTHALIETNNRYVKTCFAYFTYLDDGAPAHRRQLEQSVARLLAARKRFMETPGFDYHLLGIDQLLANAKDALADRASAMTRLENAADAEGAMKLIASQQSLHAEALNKHGAKARKFLHWRGRVDGKDVLLVKGDAVRVEHIAGDGIAGVDASFDTPLPAGPVTVLVEDLGSRAIGPFVLEQPTGKNDFTARILLFDGPPSSGWFEFNLYVVEEKPEKLGLSIPWQE